MDTLSILSFPALFLAILLLLAAVILLIKGILQMPRATVLLIDDNSEILANLGEFLKDKNYKVFEAETVEAAKDLIIKHKEDINYVVIDLDMPPQNEEKYKNRWGGIEVFHFLKDQRSKAEAIILSAYTLTELAEDGFTQEANEMRNFFIPKNNSNYILAVLDKLHI
jgi:CheY-like chemotaxis protein